MKPAAMHVAFQEHAWTSFTTRLIYFGLTRFISDHVPLIISISTHIPRPAFFRFESAWAQNPACGPKITQAWNSAHRNSNAATTLSFALKRTRQSLKRWRRSLPNQKFRETNTKCVIAFLDNLEGIRNLSSLEINLRRLLIKILQRLIGERVAFWRQRWKLKFAIEGDKNTKKFTP
jgi:hypothetical protein